VRVAERVEGGEEELSKGFEKKARACCWGWEKMGRTGAAVRGWRSGRMMHMVRTLMVAVGVGEMASGE